MLTEQGRPGSTPATWRIVRDGEEEACGEEEARDEPV
jgi:hypothetical protein